MAEQDKHIVKEDEVKAENFLSRTILSSTHINFLFGSGVNGKAFPQLSGFSRTLDEIHKYVADTNLGFEEAINRIGSDDDRNKVKKVFMKEFEEKEALIDDSNPSLVSIRSLMENVYKVVDKTQNRNVSMKQINIFTLNYDNIIENILSKSGFFYNSISASNVSKRSYLFDVIGYDYKGQAYLPSFQVSKLHGDKKTPIIPGKAKFIQSLDENYFEILYNMKEHLCRPNSILIVIGYSGNDNHINKIIEDCASHGLTIYRYKYDADDLSIGDFEIIKNVNEIKKDASGNKIRDKYIDSVESCSQDFQKIWSQQ